jgi:hypothetical protein
MQRFTDVAEETPVYLCGPPWFVNPPMGVGESEILLRILLTA